MPNKLEGLVNLTGSVKQVFVGRDTVPLLRSQFLTRITFFGQHHWVIFIILEKLPVQLIGCLAHLAFVVIPCTKYFSFQSIQK